MSPDRATLTIDLDALAHNYAVVATEAVGCELAPVVKADGYGLGAGPIARRLWAEGARRFFVARIAEGEALRAALGPGRPAVIHVLDGFLPGCGDRLAAADLTPVLSTLPQVAAASAWATGHGRLAVALQVDTGMNRQGLTLEEAEALASRPSDIQGLEVDLLVSHLGSAAQPQDPRSHAQLTRFQRARELFPGVRTSLGASAGAFLGPDYRGDIVRPGIVLYGGGPQERPDPRIRAVATLSAPILDIRTLQAGDRVGYGETFTAEHPLRVAIIAAGYADGVIRAAAGAGYAWCAGARRRLLVVTMDLLVIEIGDAAAAPGDPVELLGPNVHVDDLAAAAGTAPHEVLVRLSPRAERIYVGLREP